jgi:dCTP deaminase
MILCEREIQALVRNQLVVIDPCPPPESPRWSSTALDLTLDGVVLEWVVDNPPPTGGGRVGEVSPFSDTFNVLKMMDDPRSARKVPIPEGDGYPLKPGGFILGFTVEKVRIPHECRIAARVEGKSSLARLGLGVHVTAPTIHAGFGAEQGKSPIPIQLEIFNLGPWVINLKGGMRICQLIFEEVREVPTTGYQGQFQGQQPFTSAE